MHTPILCRHMRYICSALPPTFGRSSAYHIKILNVHRPLCYFYIWKLWCSNSEACCFPFISPLNIFQVSVVHSWWAHIMGDSDTSVTSQASSGSGSSGKNSLSSYLPASAATKRSHRTTSRGSASRANKLTGSLKVSFGLVKWMSTIIPIIMKTWIWVIDKCLVGVNEAGSSLLYTL